MLKIRKISSRKNVGDLTVKDNHNFYSNNILVHNCVEIVLPVSPIESIYDVDSKEENLDRSNGEIALCTLAAFNLGNIKSFKELHKVAEYIVRILEYVVENQDYPINAAKKMLSLS